MHSNLQAEPVSAFRAGQGRLADLRGQHKEHATEA